jgi:prepilin-type N-terminal cleavage/methylation domain-containing protein
MNRTYIQKSKKGFSLLELLLVLGIIAALIVAAFIVFPKVQAEQRANRTIQDIAAIDAGIKSLYASKAGYDGLSTKVLINANVFPDIMTTTVEGQAYNVFKGRVNVSEVTSLSSPAYSISFYSVPPTECSKIVSSLWGRFFQIEIISGSGMNVKSYNGQTMKLSTITKQCTNTDSATLIFWGR